jgi:hypothetical protein
MPPHMDRWLHAIHQVTGGMALRFTKATAADIQHWAGMLRATAAEMELAAAELCEIEDAEFQEIG